MRLTNFQDKKVASYQQKGSSKTLVLLHGFCEDSRMWEEWLQGFSDHHLIRIDLPGFGKSDPMDQPSIETMADSVQAVLEDRKISKCVLIGHSMGGYVALEFARKYAAYLEGLGLFHSHPFADSEETRLNRQKGIDFIHNNGHIYYIKQLISSIFPPVYARSNRMLVDKLIFRGTQFSQEGIIGGLKAMMDREDRTEVWSNIACPTLCILGEIDTVVPPHHFDQMAMPDIVDVHLLSGIGHMGMFENRRKTERIVRKYLDFLAQ